MELVAGSWLSPAQGWGEIPHLPGKQGLQGLGTGGRETGAALSAMERGPGDGNQPSPRDAVWEGEGEH